MKPTTIPHVPSQVGWGGGAEAYLMAIYVLLQEEPPEQVVSARVAEYLGVSPVSVSRALTRLQRMGDLERKVPTLALTAQGWARAESLLRHHHIAERWLTDELGLDWVTAHQEAERLGGALSERVVSALWERLGKPQRCPHGTPIPGTGVPQLMAEPLSAVPSGFYVIDRVTEQVEGLVELLQRLQSAGLTPGIEIEVRATPRGGEPQVRLTRAPAPWLTLESWLARRILVRSHPSR